MAIYGDQSDNFVGDLIALPLRVYFMVFSFFGVFSLGWVLSYLNLDMTSFMKLATRARSDLSFNLNGCCVTFTERSLVVFV